MIRLAKILPSLRCFLWILCCTKFCRHLYWWDVTPSAGCWHGDCRQYLGPAAAKHRQIYWLPPGPGPGQPISLLSLRAVPASLLPQPRLLLHHLWVCLCLRVLSVHCRCCLASIQRQVTKHQWSYKLCPMQYIEVMTLGDKRPDWVIEW